MKGAAGFGRSRRPLKSNFPNGTPKDGDWQQVFQANFQKRLSGIQRFEN